MYYINIKGDIYMKAFKGSFKKKSGDEREMFFARISDLPGDFIAT